MRRQKDGVRKMRLRILNAKTPRRKDAEKEPGKHQPPNAKPEDEEAEKWGQKNEAADS